MISVINWRARGIHLLVVPAPNKESVYPEQLSRRAPHNFPWRFVNKPNRSCSDLKAADVEVVNLFELYAERQISCFQHRPESPCI